MFIHQPIKGSYAGALSWKCDACHKESWPVRRIAGFPTEQAQALVEAGLAAFAGCDAIMDGHAFQCPHCEAGCEVDESLVAEGHWDLDH